jgi:hypothetical protein
MHSDAEFVDTLHATVLGYLDAVDRWEAAYGSVYRLPGVPGSLSADMEAVQLEYQAQGRHLAPLLPRARRLCLKYGLRNPLPGLLRISLGLHAPQHRLESAISRGERNAVMECLLGLADATGGRTDSESQPAAAQTESEPQPSWSRRAILAGVVCGGVGAGLAIGHWSPRTNREETPASLPPQSSPGRKDAGGHFYQISERPLTDWGDYGDILQHGMTSHLERVDGMLRLERTGPYMPPITFPGLGDVVVNSAGRKMLETSGLSGFGFRPVHKTRIVELRWHDWDLTAREPAEYPRSGEPEDYILERLPDARVAEAIGDIWEVVVPVTARIGQTPEKAVTSYDLYLKRESWNGADVFRGYEAQRPLVTARARVWFEEYLGGYVEFEEFSCR